MMVADAIAVGTRTQGAVTAETAITDTTPQGRVSVSTKNCTRGCVTPVGPQTSQSGAYNHGYETNEDSFGDGDCRDVDVRYSNGDSEYGYAGEDERGHVPAVNDHERRAVAEGMFARSDNRRTKGDGNFSNDRSHARDSCSGRQQYGPCAACGSVQTVKQVHDAGKCEAFNELASLLQSTVDENDLTPMLQSLVLLFAFAEETKWPEDCETGFVNTTETVEKKRWKPRGPNETSSRSLVRVAKLLPGARLRWWSSQRYDKRKRMRAVVMGAIDNTRTRILLDTGANHISVAYAKRLRLSEVPDHGRSLEVRGINPGVLETRRRSLVKIIPGWDECVDVVLGTDFMIPAGVRLDLFHGIARLPDDVVVPLVKSAGATDGEQYGAQAVGGPTEDLYVPRGEWREFRLPRKRPSRATHELWIRRTIQMVPMVMESRRGKPVWVRLTNASDGTAWCYKHTSVVLWIPRGELPREVGYVRLDSSKYNKWQVLAYAEGRGETLLLKENELYECWLAEQPPAVECREYATSEQILVRLTEVSGALGKPSLAHLRSVDGESHCAKHYEASEASVAVGLDEDADGESDTRQTELSDAEDD
ncbi:LOW QUALITY PROTEIN: hypothetical protein PHMEG_00015736 [Phytophthora megakarya]|uniref:Peptidase A2 domain-containing protein n=1 Tax=Phytophthora megakarya TaxID=4795 RepID=A0A225W0I7_9STRA|nr:LOW QUALITY PROTEIN: hypothetical protein PHMEG_00015736 [Phytophthora megakarya]